MKNIFDIIEHPEDGSCTILLYGEIGDCSDVTPSDFLARIMEAEKTCSHIDVRINSVGGQVGAGIAIFNALRSSAADITIWIDYLAASTASFIASCGRTVKMSRYAQIMIHKPTGGVWGNADEIKSYMDQLTQIEGTICDIYARRTGLSVDEIRERYMDGQDHWLGAEEAVRLGFADEVYDGEPAVFEDSAPLDQKCRRFTDMYGKIFIHQNNNEKMLDKIKKMQPFGDCADETAVINRLQEIIRRADANDTLKTENDALKAKLAAIEKEKADAADAAINAEVDAAVKDGRIDESQREKFVRMLHTSEAEAARDILNGLKPKKLVKDVLDNGTVVPSGAWEKRQEEIRGNYNKRKND